MFPLLRDTYRFIVEVTATDTGTGFYELTPMEQKLEWRWSRDNELGVWGKELATKLTFRNNAAKGIFDFDILKAEYDYADRCIVKDFYIQRKCGVGSFENFYKCEFRINKCVWDFDKCEVVAEVHNVHPLWCILNEKKGSNLLNADGNVYLKRFGTHQTEYTRLENVVEWPPKVPAPPELIITQEEFLELPPAPDLDGVVLDTSLGWTEIQTTVENISIDGKLGYFGFLSENGRAGYAITTNWVRIFSSVEPPDIDKWIVVPGGWAKPPDTEEVFEYDFETNYPRFTRRRPVYENQTFNSTRYRHRPPGEYGYTNGRYLEQILEMFIGFTNCQGMLIKSNFFNINPAGDTPDNEAYALAAYLFDTWKLAFWQITDTAFPLYTEVGEFTGEAATFARITFLQFLTDLKKVFNLGFGFDEDTQTIIIEHISFFKYERRIDLTSEQLVKYIRGGHKFSFDTENIPSVEKFGWSQDFSKTFGMQIDYFGSCTGDNSTESNLYAERLYTDLRYISEKYTEFQDSDGIFMALVDENGFLVEQNDTVRVNDYLSFPNLSILHYWQRPNIQGYLDETFTTFKTETKKRKQIPLAVPICCDDVNNFKPDILVKSQMGWGEIAEVTITDPPRELKLNLIFN